MKLYYSPGACSLSPHIVLVEAGLPFEVEKVDLSAKKTERGDDYYRINPKGYVPALEMAEGGLLTEGPAIVQYLADRVPEKRLAPPNGTLERYRLQEWLNYISTELHKGFSPLFSPSASEEWKTLVKERLVMRFTLAAQHLADRPYLMGETFTVADAYLFTILRWTGHTGVDVSGLPELTAYHDRVAARPAVQATLQAEGLT